MEDTNKNTELVSFNPSKLSRDEQIDLLERLNELDRRLKYNKLSLWFPETGPYRRDLYPKILKFFEAGNTFGERVIMGANRSGKSTAGTYEACVHITGDYPKWWKGKKLLSGRDVTVWMCGDTYGNVRDILQKKLLGNVNDIGSGMLPKKGIIQSSVKRNRNVNDAIESFQYERADGGIATVLFKSYIQGRELFQGDAVDVIILDEEPHLTDIYTECVTRTMATGEFPGGMVITQFTPLNGLTPVVERFFRNDTFPENGVVLPTREEPFISRYVINVDWEDAPHLSDSEKKRLWSSYLPHEREARAHGRPVTGSGKIYQVLESDFIIQPFEIPYTWPKWYALDFALSTGGTAIVWFAYQESTDIMYVTNVFFALGAKSHEYAAAIKAQGSWIRGVVDPSAKRERTDRVKWITYFESLGLDLSFATNSVDLGIAEVTRRLQEGKLKVFWNCTPLIEQYRKYRRDDFGKVAKNQIDDVMDAWRYGVISGKNVMLSLAEIDEDNNREERFRRIQDLDNTCDVTGY